jgi:hypothetical protein
MRPAVWHARRRPPAALPRGAADVRLFASSVALLKSAARCSSNSSFLCWNSSRSFSASVFSRRRPRVPCGDTLLPRIDGVEDGLVEKALQQPHQDEKVDHLRTDGEPVDEHGSYFPGGLGDDVVPERVGEDENHRDHETVDGRGLDHRQTHEQGPGDGGGGVRLLGQRELSASRPRALRPAPAP